VDRTVCTPVFATAALLPVLIPAWLAAARDSPVDFVCLCVCRGAWACLHAPVVVLPDYVGCRLADEVDGKSKPKKDKSRSSRGGVDAGSSSPPGSPRTSSKRGGSTSTSSGKEKDKDKEKEKGLSSSDLLARLLVPGMSPSSSAPGYVAQGPCRERGEGGGGRWLGVR
jgi:hypothetical protein